LSLSSDEDSDTDYDVDYECDDMAATALLSQDDDGYLKPATSERHNGIYSENRPVDGLANNINGPRYEMSSVVLFMLFVKVKDSSVVQLAPLLTWTYLLALLHTITNITNTSTVGATGIGVA